MRNIKSKNPVKSRGEVLQRSAELKRKKKIGSWVIFWITIVFVLSLMGYLLYCPAFTINNVTVDGARIMDTDNISDYVTKAISGKFWLVFPEKNTFLFPDKGVEAGLIKKFPRIEEARVDLIDRNTLNVTVKERDFDTVWCREQVTYNSSSTENGEPGDCFFADEKGLVFASAPTFVGSVFTELHGGLPTQPVGLKPLLEKNYRTAVGFARDLANVFKKSANEQYRLVAMDIIDSDNFSARIIDSSKTSNNDWQIFINGESDHNSLAGKLYTILESAAFRKDMLDHKNDLASIDLRYGGKVFYKFKD